MVNYTMKRALTLCVLFLSLCFIRGQNFTAMEIPTGKQMPTAFLHRFLYDSDGYMWYATNDAGLCRDNGYQIDVFGSDDAMPERLGNNHVLCFDEDGEKRIWAGTDKGMYILSKRQGYAITLVDIPGFHKTRIDAIQCASDGTVWMATKSSVFHLDSSGKVLKVYFSKWKNEHHPVSNIYEDSRERIWITQWQGGLLRYDAKQDSLLECEWTLQANPNNLTEDSVNHCFWVTTWGQGVVRYEPLDLGTRAVVTTFPEIWNEGNAWTNVSQTLELHYDAEDSLLWITAMTDLMTFKVKDGQLMPFSTESFLPHTQRTVDDVKSDRTGNIWVASFSPHSFIISRDPNPIRHFRLESLSRKEEGYKTDIDDILYDGRDFWFWINRKGLVWHDPVNDAHFRLGQGGSEYIYLEPFFANNTSEQGIWVCSGSRVLRLWHGSSDIQWETVCDLESTGTALADEGKDGLWIGDLDKIYRYSKKTRQVQVMAERLGYVSKLLPDGRGGVFALSDSLGLAHIDKEGNLESVAHESRFVSMAMSDKMLWLVSRYGTVSCYDIEKKTMQEDEYVSQGFGKNLMDLAVDAKGHIWLMSNQYVKEYNPVNHAFRLFHCSDQNIDMDYFHSIYGYGEDIYVGGTRGYCILHPSANLDPGGGVPSTTFVTTLRIDGQMEFLHNGCRNWDIEAGRQNVDVYVSTFDHVHAQKITFAYRMKGENADWTYLPQGANLIHLANLTKGPHVLEVMATNRYGYWCEPVEVITINRLPAWYETWWAFLLYILATALVLTLLVRYLMIRQRTKRKRMVEQQVTEMKFRFFTNISHELRTPLTLIITPVESLIHAFSEQKARKTLPSVYRNAKELLELINRLLDFRKLEMGEQKLDLANGDIYEYIRSSAEAFRPMAEARQIQLLCKVPEGSLYMFFDRRKLHHIIYNLLSNAFKFSQEGGLVRIETVPDDLHAGMIRIVVEDCGKGIDEKDLPHIFERFYQASSSRQSDVHGTGIGLNMVKEFVLLHQGSIDVSSKVGRGTSFTILLPLTLGGKGGAEPAHANPHVADSQQSQVFLPASDVRGADADIRQGKPVILLVDDNVEFRQFLSDDLSNHYQVIEAANGRQALQLAQENDVDVVVSDVMMPVMDGNELCRKLKEEVSTSHIFVILLTARAGEDSELEGYQSGADCYINKPFNMEILHNRIRHFLDMQVRRKEHFVKEDTKTVEESITSEIDRQVLSKAVAIVEKHIADESFSVELLSSDMCMSRMNLYRKLRSLTGQSPVEFIRTIRLKRAGELLLHSDMTVAEVADAVGFGTASHFSRCFREFFGVSPSQYGR